MSKQLYLSLLDTERNRELRELAKARAKAEGRTQSDVIASALAAYLGTPENRPNDVMTRHVLMWLKNDRTLNAKAMKLAKGEGSKFAKADEILDYLRDYAPRMMTAEILHHALCLVSVKELAEYMQELEAEE
jgi:hypothetical protein